MSKILIFTLFITLASFSYTFFNPAVFHKMAQLGEEKAKMLAQGEAKTQLDEFKTTYPVIYDILQEGSGNAECDKIRVDSFSDCKFTFDGIKDLELKHQDAYYMTEAIFTKCVAISKELCPL